MCFEPDRIVMFEIRIFMRTSRRLLFRSLCNQPQWWREFLQDRHLGTVPTRRRAALLYFRRSQFCRLVVLPLTLVSFLSACHKWVDVEPPLAAAIERAEPDRVRLTVDGERFILSVTFA